MKFILGLTLSYLLAYQAKAASNSCSINLVSECPGLENPYSPTEHACLLKAYACGDYEQIAQRLSGRKTGLAREHNYFLGSAYFGLSNRNNSQALKCHYIKAAKEQFEEFLSAVNDDPKSKVSLSSEASMDMLYHATRSYKALQTEAACAESSYSEGTIDRKARLYTHERMSTLLHNASDPGAKTGAELAVQNGFNEMKDSLNSFVTVASQLESRSQLYGSQLKAAKTQLNMVAMQVHDIFGDEAVTIDIVNEMPKITLNEAVINARLKEIEDKVTLVTGKGGSLDAIESKSADYFVKNSKHYNGVKVDMQQKISQLRSSIAMLVNTFQNSGTGAEEITKALNTDEGKFQAQIESSESMGSYFSSEKKKCPKRPVANKPWYCK